MTIRLRISDNGDVHEGSSDPTAQRVPSSQPTEAEIVAQSKNPLTVEEYGSLIMSQRAQQDPAYRRELDARLAAGHYHGEMQRAVAAQQPQDAYSYIRSQIPDAPDSIIRRGMAMGTMTREETLKSVSSQEYKTSEDARQLHAVRLVLEDLS